MALAWGGTVGGADGGGSSGVWQRTEEAEDRSRHNGGLRSGIFERVRHSSSNP